MVVQIVPTVQNYDWGKIGTSSKVATLSNTLIAPEKPYAELWMGTHTTSPSKLPDGRLLADIVSPSTMGEKIYKEYGQNLPFLFKVLSIGKALSIQAHPDKALAQKLHANFPKIYKDPNHKPEMAIALTQFEAFVGFRPLASISENLTAFPELASLIEPEILERFKAQASYAYPVIASSKIALKALFGSLMRSSNLTPAITSLVARLQSSNISYPKGSLEELVLRLYSEFGVDIGIFCAFLLNYVSLAPGQAIFLAANEPHAYISGDCVECMAASDNVVRSGLTPKFKDVDTLVEMLTYNHGPADKQILNGEQYNGLPNTKIYDPPIEEFTILKTELFPPKSEHFEGINGPSLLLVTEGHGVIESGEERVDAKEGSVFFVGAGEKIALHSVGEKNAVFYRAFCI